MKDSDLGWLGRVPEHWQLRRTKTLLSQRSEKGAPDEPLLAATQTKGVVRKEQFADRTVVAIKDLHLLKRVHVGDFVISLRSFQGGIEYAREWGIISPAYTILYPVEEDYRPFLALLFKSKPYIDNLSLYVTGIRQGQNIDYEKLARSRLPLPPSSERCAIARFPRPRRPAHPALHPRQGKADCAAGRAEAGHYPPSYHGADRRSNRTALRGLQGLRSSVAKGDTTALGRSTLEAGVQSNRIWDL